jgi:hypothetical protein
VSGEFFTPAQLEPEDRRKAEQLAQGTEERRSVRSLAPGPFVFPVAKPIVHILEFHRAAHIS